MGTDSKRNKEHTNSKRNKSNIRTTGARRSQSCLPQTHLFQNTVENKWICHCFYFENSSILFFPMFLAAYMSNEQSSYVSLLISKSQCPHLSQASSLSHLTRPASGTKLPAQIHNQGINELQFLALGHTKDKLDHTASRPGRFWLECQKLNTMLTLQVHFYCFKKGKSPVCTL